MSLHSALWNHDEHDPIECAQGELRTRVKLLPITFWVLSPNTARICCFDDKMVEEHDVFWCPLPGIIKISSFFCLFPHLLACWKKKDAVNRERGNADCQDWRNSSPTQETKYRLTANDNHRERSHTWQLP